MSKTNDIVNQNKKLFESYNSYLIQGNKYVLDQTNNRHYPVSVRLQIFTDNEGNVKMIREQ